MIIYIILPLLLVPGFFIKNKSLCCLWCGFVLFVMSALYFNSSVANVYNALDVMSIQDLSFTGLPFSFLYIAKFFSMIVPDYRIFTVVFSLISTAGLMLYIKKYCYYPAASAVVAVATGLWFMGLSDPAGFLGLIISAFAMRYAFEKRFVRFGAILLLASCFLPEAIYLIPLYIFFIIQPTVWHLPVAAGAAFLLLVTDITGELTFLGEDKGAAADLILPLIITVICVCCCFAMKIIARRGSYNLNIIIVLLVASVLSVGALNDSRLMLYALICFFPAALTLVPEIISVAKALISLVFREKKKPVLICSGVVLLVVAALVYGYVLESGVFAIPAYETWLGTEVTV